MDSRLKLILKGDPEEVLMLLIRLKSPGTIIPNCEVITQFGDIITSRVKRKYLIEIYNSPDTLSVKAPRLITASLYNENENNNTEPHTEDPDNPSRQLQSTYSGEGVYFATVDWGFDIGHKNLCNPDGTTRFKCFWDQNGIYDGNKYGYGCFYSADEINQALRTDTPYQTLGYHPGKEDALGAGMHGTHVIDIATGTPAVGEGGVANKCHIVGVQLGNNFVNGSDLALGDSVKLIEALHYIYSVTQDVPCVINMSLGSHGDSHTGKSLVEIAFDNFLNQNPGYAIVQSVGNYYLAHCHIQHTIKQDEKYNIEWNIPRRNFAPDEVEIWYPGSDEFSLRLITPDGEPVADVPAFKDIQISYQGEPFGYIFHRANEPNTGLNHIDIILDVSIVKGKWIIELTGTKVKDGAFHAYCERNDASQSKFSANQTSPYTTTGSVCNSKNAITVGAYNHRETVKPVVSFSSSGPTVFGQSKPDLLAPGYKIKAARSAASDNYNATNQLTIKSGSSMAAPHVSGGIALLFQKYLPERLSIEKVKQLLYSSMDPLLTGSSPADKVRSGNGYLNINNLLNKNIVMETNDITRPVRRQKEIETGTENLPAEQERHAPYLHANCPDCEQALLESISEGIWANETQLLNAINLDSFNHDINPFDLYRHFNPRYQFEYRPYADNFFPVALPGKPYNNDFRVGDFIIIRNILSGKTLQAIIANPELFIKEDIDGYNSDSVKPGYYLQVYGNTSGNSNNRFYLRISDAGNVLLDNLLILRKILPYKFSNEDYSEISTRNVNNDQFQIREPLRQEGEEIKGHDDVKGRIKWFMESRFGKKRGPSEQQLVAYADASKNLSRLKQNTIEDYNNEEISLFEDKPILSANNWTSLGPWVIEHGQASGNPEVSGRVTSIAAGDSGNRVYVGTANGGLWYSGNEGNTWEPLDEWGMSAQQPGVEADSLSIGSIAVKFGNRREEDIIYVGTGEPLAEWKHWSTQAVSAISYFGIGVKYSNDGGRTWALEGTKVRAGKINLLGVSIYKIVIDPSDSNKAFAATSSGLFQRLPTNPDKWSQVITSGQLNTPGAVINDFIVADNGVSRKYYAAILYDDVYESIDLINWTTVSGIDKRINTIPSLPTVNQNPNRIVLSLSEKDPTILYALHQFADKDATGTNVIYKTNLYQLAGSNLSRLSTTIFNKVNNVPSIFNGANGQGWYSLAIAVDPSDSNTLYLAGNYFDDGSQYPLSLYKGKINTVGGLNFLATYVGTGVHADVHIITFALNSSGTRHDENKVWIGCDGGIFYSNMAGANKSFISKNKGLAITQMTYLGHHPDLAYNIFTGCQDNGTLLHNGIDWYEIEPGDGGGVAIDPNNPMQIMSQYTSAELWKSAAGGTLHSWSKVSPPLDDHTSKESKATRFYSPIDVFSKNKLSTMIAFGTNRLWLSEFWGGLDSTGNSSWRTLPTNTNPYAGLVPMNQDKIETITSIKIASATKIYATTESDVYQYTLNRGNWQVTQLPKIGLTLRDYFITAIDTYPNNSNHFYVALGGPGSFERCYYYDGNWHPVGPDKAILDIPCHAIVVDPLNPHILYLGSDIGVWKYNSKLKPAKRWQQFSYGLPQVAVTDLKIHHKTRLLRVATHGRGIYEIRLKQRKVDLFIMPQNISTVRQLTVNPSAFIIVTVNNRGYNAATAANVRVYLLMSEVHGLALLALPPNLSSDISSGKIISLPLGWQFADTSNPFKTLAGNVDSLTTQDVSFNVDFSSITTPQVVIAAIVTTIDAQDQYKLTETDLNKTIMRDKHIAYRIMTIT